jgi:hypothetical protein
MSESSFDKAAQEAAAFQKMYLESISKTLQAAFKFTPESAPPQVLQQIRAGILQALAESWEQFMRSDQFLEGMRQWMDNAVSFRSLTNEFLGRLRNEGQAPSRSDIDTVLLAVRHMEKRLLDRLEELSTQLTRSDDQRARPSKTTRRAGKARKTGRTGRSQPINGK